MLKYTIFALAVMITAHSACAGDESSVEIDPQSYGFAALSVPDIESSIAWYQVRFGLKKGLSYASEDDSVQIVVLSRPGLTVELQSHSSAKKAPGPADKAFLHHGIFKFGVQVLDMDSALKKLVEAGTEIVVPPFDDQNGQYRSAIIRDDSGNLVQLFQRVPRRPEVAK